MDLAALTDWWQRTPAMLLVLARLGALFATAPLIGGPYVPNTVKALLTTAIALLITPQIPSSAVATDARFFVQIIREVALGLALGWLVSLAFEAVKMAGELINRHAGFSAAENFDPDSGIGNGPMGDVLHLGLVLVFFAADGHLMLLAQVVKSFHIIPLGGWSVHPPLAEVLAHGIRDGWTIALSLSFPVLAVIMAITLVEGMMSRAVPQINVMQLSFAVKIVVSVGVLSAGLPAIVASFAGILASSQDLATAFIALR